MPWNPDQYAKFQAERFAPFDDALALVKRRRGLSVVDLGCGGGELTARLADALPESDVLGVDSSDEMLVRAEKFAGARLRFEKGALESVQATFDLVFSHAAIQWVDDHTRLVPQLLSLVRPEGQLVVQLPSNHGHTTHVLIRTIASEEPFRTALSGWTRASPVLGIEEYAELLHHEGAREITVFEKVYPHLLEGAEALAEWTAGTALVPYFERLPRDLHNVFMDRYRARLLERYPERPVFYGFRRTLFAATR